MSYEVWAIDVGAGEAIVRQASEWSLLSLDSGWQTVSLHGPADVFRWSFSSRAVPVGRSYANLEEAVSDVREATSAALRHVLDPGFSRNLLPIDGEYHSPSLNSRRQSRTEFLGRAFRRQGARRGELAAEVITQESGRLERALERWGCSREGALDLMALSFAKLLGDPRGWDDQDALSTRLFVLAHSLHQEITLGRATPSWTSEIGDLPLQQWVDRRIEGLPYTALQVVATWTNLDLSYRDIQVILQSSRQELEESVRVAAKVIGLAAELLRVRLFAPACRRAAETVLERQRH